MKNHWLLIVILLGLAFLAYLAYQAFISVEQTAANLANTALSPFQALGKAIASVVNLFSGSSSAPATAIPDLSTQPLPLTTPQGTPYTVLPGSTAYGAFTGAYGAASPGTVDPNTGLSYTPQD